MNLVVDSLQLLDPVLRTSPSRCAPSTPVLVMMGGPLPHARRRPDCSSACRQPPQLLILVLRSIQLRLCHSSSAPVQLREAARHESASTARGPTGPHSGSRCIIVVRPVRVIRSAAAFRLLLDPVCCCPRSPLCLPARHTRRRSRPRDVRVPSVPCRDVARICPTGRSRSSAHGTYLRTRPRFVSGPLTSTSPTSSR